MAVKRRCLQAFALFASVRDVHPFLPASRLLGQSFSATKVWTKDISERLEARPWRTSLSSAVDKVQLNKQDDHSFDDSKESVRPVHQNWWPVSALSALDESRPNALECLGKKLVTYRGNGEWNVLDDRCSHRFAPLSEGRVLPESCSIQCSYHGWEFSSNGACSNVPQQPDKVDKARGIQSYRIQEKAGMLWIWMDPDTSKSLADTVHLPISPLLERYVNHFGSAACFMRDLPYGMELLGENLVDLSHLPFAHHSVGSLNRETGGELPTRMLSEIERESNMDWETEPPYNKSITVQPTFQAEIEDAAKHDPSFLSLPDSLPGDRSTWRCTIGYFAPSHVRYRRTRDNKGSAGHVELFMCPKSEGKSRVFLFNCFESLLPDYGSDTGSGPSKSHLSSLFKPQEWKATMMKALFGKLTDPRRVAGHMMAHTIFDGDGIFLHKQGNRMKEAGLSFKDYSTPSSADVLLNAYRRFLDKAVTVTERAGETTAAKAVQGSEQYGDDELRSKMLDRYNTHTVFCPICSTGLEQTRNKKRRLKLYQSVLSSASGTFGILTLVASRLQQRLFTHPVTGVLKFACATAISALLSYFANRYERRLDVEISRFLFEDYVHAEKE